MSPLIDVRVSYAPPSAPNGRGLVRWLCTSNPFYVLSAGLFLAGLYISFGAQAEDVQTWALMSGLAGYTLLLAVTAFLLVRFGGVWDDVRTVLLLVVLMFLATSVTFDEVLVLDPDRGLICYLGGLLFAAAVSEALLRGIRLAMPSLFRVPYYLILSLFFLYPLALQPLAAEPRSEALIWGLFGFSPVAGLVFLTLLPAIRRGPDYVRDNGSPWRWPLYPWVLFGLLSFAVPARAFLLCWSMQLLDSGDRDHLIFGPFFLVPFGLAVAVLLLEIGHVSRRRSVMGTALAVPAVLVVLTVAGHRDDPIYRDFLTLFAARIDDPLTVTLLALVGFYGYALLRRAPLAAEALTATLVALAVVGPDTLDRHEFFAPQPLPLLAAAALQLELGLRHRQSRRWLLTAGLGVVACWRGYCRLRQVVVGLDHMALSLVLFVVALLISLGKSGILARWIAAWRGDGKLSWTIPRTWKENAKELRSCLGTNDSLSPARRSPLVLERIMSRNGDADIYRDNEPRPHFRPLVCFAILPILLSTPLFAAERSWVGKQVMPKQAGIRIWYADDQWRHVSVGNFEDMIVAVLAERGEWLKVRHQGVDAWFARQDAVLLDDAVAYFTEKIRANADDVFAHVMRAEARHAKGQRDGSIEDYTEAIRRKPKDAGLHDNRGLLYLETKDYNRAVADFEEAIRLNPKSVSAFNSRAFAYAAQGDYDRAIHDYDEAIHLDPNDPAIWNYRGAACFKKGDYNRAINDYREAIRLDPASARSYCNRGLAWLGRKEYEKAIKDFGTAIRLEPAYVPPYNHLARIAAASVDARMRDGRRAVAYARKACELTAWKDAASLDWLAAACAECGQFAEAVKWQQKAIELGYPDEASAAEARQRLQLYAERKPLRIAEL